MKLKIVLFMCIILWVDRANSQVAVIANKSIPADKISATQLLDFYTGDVRLWSNDEPVIIFDLEPRGPLKETFYKFLGKTISRMKSIWMKKLLSGEGDPPEAIKSEEELLQKVIKTKGAVGFISLEKVNKDVKVLTVIETKNK